MAASTTYVGTTLATPALGTTAAVTLGSLIGIDALTIIFGLFGGFVALAFPLTKADPDRGVVRPMVHVIRVIAAGMVAASLTEFSLVYAMQHAQVTHEAAAKAVSFTLGYLAKWLLPSMAFVFLNSRKLMKEMIEFLVTRK